MQINQVWTEGKVSKVSKEGQITVTVTAPGGGGGGKDSSALVVFSDTSGQVWAREVWNKKGAKQAALRQGWTFSDTSGRWAVRGQAVGGGHTHACGGDHTHALRAGVHSTMHNDSVTRFCTGEPPSTFLPCLPVNVTPLRVRRAVPPVH